MAGGGGGGEELDPLFPTRAVAEAAADLRLLSLRLVNEREDFGFLVAVGELGTVGERVECGESGCVVEDEGGCCGEAC